MRTLLFALPILFFAEAVTANDAVKLRAGEHATYSRIVIPESSGWTVSSEGRDVVILFDSGTWEFDISDLTDKQKAHRAETARLEDRDGQTALIVSLNCNCSVETSPFSENGALIDIYDAPGATAVTLRAKPGTEIPVTTPAPQQQVAQAEDQSAPQPTVLVEETKTADAQPEGTQAANIVDQSQPDLVVPVAPLSASLETKRDAQLETQLSETLTPSPTARKRDDNSGPPDDLLAARDRMIALLAEARARGVVELKDTPEGEKIARANDPSAEDEEGAEEEARAVCFDAATLADLPGDSRSYEALMNLRKEYENSEEESDRLRLARDVAFAYLRIGFFEEASAIAMSEYAFEDPLLKIAAGLAEIGGAAKADAETIFDAYTHCGPPFEVLNAAIAARDGIEYRGDLGRRQFNALNSMMRSMRGPLAELFALNAIDNDQPANLRRFYEIATRARAPETNDAIALIENALSDVPDDDIEAIEPILEIAQIPGPMQTRALGELAALYERNAEIAYEGFLEDLAAEKTKRSGRRADARASFAGARALAISGRVGESVDLLVKAGTSFSAARLPARQLARSVIMDALASNDQLIQLVAIDAFLRHAEFLSRDVNGDDSINVAVARKLADLGLNKLTDDVIAAAHNTNKNPEHLIVRAQALLNAGDAPAAQDLAAKQSRYLDAVIVALKAAERLGESASVKKTVAKAIKDGEVTVDFADAAWRAGEWELAAAAYALIESDDVGVAERYALAAMMSGADEIPESALESLQADPASLATIEHMYAPPPTFVHGNLDTVAAYSDGVADEMARIRERLSNE